MTDDLKVAVHVVGALEQRHTKIRPDVINAEVKCEEVRTVVTIRMKPRAGAEN